MHNYKILVLKTVDPEKWNGWIASSYEGLLFQTTFWADRLQELVGYDPRYMLIYERHGQYPVGQFLYFRTAYRHLSFWQRPFNAFILKKLKQYAPVYLWHGGPTILDGISIEEQRLIVSMLFEKLESEAQKEGVIAIEPSEVKTIPSWIVPDGWTVEKWGSFQINLLNDEESLWKNLRPSARKAIRKAQHDGVSVRRIKTFEELREYYNFTVIYAQRFGKRMYSFSDLSTMWKYFKGNAIFEIFIAEYQTEVIAGLGIWGYHGIISEFGAFQSQKSFESKTYGQDLIKWEVIKWGSAQGFRYYDLAGVNPNPKTAKESGIAQFKKKWGGQYVEYSILSRPNNTFNILLSRLNFFRKFRP